MKPLYQMITREIPAKGIAYLILNRCAPEQTAEVLAQAAEQVRAQGAAQILAASTDPLASLHEGRAGRFQLEHVHDMLILERELLEIPAPAGRLTLEPLSRDRGDLWLALHNASFFPVPNSATYDSGDLEAALSDARSCGFALLDGTAVGVFELNLSAQPPEIEGIALHPSFQGRGLGRELLNLLLEELRQAGYGRCQLIVSTANRSAWTLYQAVGFRQTGVKSRWYRLSAV